MIENLRPVASVSR